MPVGAQLHSVNSVFFTIEKGLFYIFGIEIIHHFIVRFPGNMGIPGKRVAAYYQPGDFIWPERHGRKSIAHFITALSAALQTRNYSFARGIAQP
jgi:hypothetical protein